MTHLRMSRPEQRLRRSIRSCMLLEDEQSIADRIIDLVPRIPAPITASIAVEARETLDLSHVALLIIREMARLDTHKQFVSVLLQRVIRGPKELVKFLEIYWREERQPLSAQVKKGLALAFKKFSKLQLANYEPKGSVSLRDAIFMVHARPESKSQGRLWSDLIRRTRPEC